jgi:opacity protein-like surface antigen
MKKIYLSILLCTMISVSFGQQKEEGFHKDDKVITGAIGYQRSKSVDNLDNSFNMSYRVGFFLSNHILIGLQTGYGQEKIKTGGVTQKDNSSVNFGAFSRYYFTPEKKFSFFGNLGVNYFNFNNYVSSINPTSVYDLSLSPGLNYFITKNLSLEASIGRISFSREKFNTIEPTFENNFNFDFNLSNIQWGIVYKF